MERIVANFCDNALLFMAEWYTDAANTVLFDRLTQEFKMDFCHDVDQDDEEATDAECSLDFEIDRCVKLWWSRYPSAFKYRNYEYA